MDTTKPLLIAYAGSDGAKAAVEVAGRLFPALGGDSSGRRARGRGAVAWRRVVRSPESWVESMHNTIAQIWFGDTLMHHLAMAQYHVDPLYASWLDLLNDMWTKADIMVASKGDPEEMATGMERWNQEVIVTVPSDRLLVWNPEDGWEPLCELLDLPVPSEPLPNVNDTENFQKNLIMRPAIDAINTWWEQNMGPGDKVAERPAPA